MSSNLKFGLHYQVRPFHDAKPNLVWPIGAAPEHWNHCNSFPSDHAAIFFALATVILINHRFLGLIAFFWATTVCLLRIYLGYHYPSDLIAGAGLGIFTVILFERLPLFRISNAFLGL